MLFGLTHHPCQVYPQSSFELWLPDFHCQGYELPLTHHPLKDKTKQEGSTVEKCNAGELNISEHRFCLHLQQDQPYNTGIAKIRVCQIAPKICLLVYQVLIWGYDRGSPVSGKSQPSLSNAMCSSSLGNFPAVLACFRLLNF